MSVQYLLPCPCGRQNVIEPRQAGETIRCSCGALLDAPTLLGMAELEPAPRPTAPVPSKAGWGTQHQLRLSGIVCLLAAVGFGGYLYEYPPTSRFQKIDPEQIRQNYKSFTPSVTWAGWNYMKKGLDRHVDQKYMDDMNQYRFKQGAVVALALLGAGLMVAGMVGTKVGGMPPRALRLAGEGRRR